MPLPLRMNKLGVVLIFSARFYERLEFFAFSVKRRNLRFNFSGPFFSVMEGTGERRNGFRFSLARFLV